jgi:predicted DCC family thiol-disulfide oxidoreductase YuxK
VERWRARTGERVEYVAYQDAELPASLDRAKLAEAAHLVETDGRLYRGAEAVLRALAHAPGGGAALALYRHVPGFRTIAEAVYGAVARNRRLASRVDRWLWGAEPTPPTYALSREIFLRGLAVVFGIAFLSFWVQAGGLVGPEGILPAATFLDAARDALGPGAYLRLPTVFWLGAGSAALHAACGAGVALSALLLLGLAPRIVLASLWLLYLSLCGIGQVFLSYQWDVLLLETALVAILIAPAGLRPRSPPPPRRAAILLGHWLLFRLMFLSGAVKLLSGDEAWRSLSALGYHYWTQPLPSPLSPWVHGLPAAFHVVSCLGMFAVELLAPFLVFAPRHAKVAAALLFVGLQLGIGVTGNYGFFGPLTCVLCALLVDDSVWKRAFRGRLIRTGAASGPASSAGRARSLGLAAVVGAVLVVTSAETLERLGAGRLVPRAVRAALGYTRPFRSFNSYGLFAIMTKDRPEILLEGSADGHSWRGYDFRYKPDRLDEPPVFVQPHMPRLDWQMWFAALHGSCRRDPWFLELVARLLGGSKPVVELFADDPFPEGPPLLIRSSLYRYVFADVPTLEGARLHWSREPLGAYCPTLTLEDGRLQIAPIP